MLLVDLHGCEGLAGYPDRDHCRQIVGGTGVRAKIALMGLRLAAPTKTA